MKKLFIGSDHGALELKQALVNHFSTVDDLDVTDCGTYSVESVDYPDIAADVVSRVLGSPNAIGILCCGTGIGISIKANRYKNIRAALVFDEFTAKMAKEHNNANILCLGGRTTQVNDAIKYVSIWLDADFESGRHQRRLDKLDT